eukprot:c27425_g1_i1.p1 GENE.c27425_g1_i1~~c27425_g1_i1.p1  ORF type:complete len:192 (+),score=83.99 c27425_g1_i1:24-599(+)
MNENNYEKEYKNFAIWGKNIGLELGGKQILKKLNINVQTGCIFTLLGPSGCGKTSLIKSLLGLYSLNEGEVRVLGNKPRSLKGNLVGDIGYVPQSLGLHWDLTVWEHLSLYAKISNVPYDEIEHRVKEFIESFKLTQLTTKIANLSFGDQKLVSVCSALIIKPKVAILDEPTVGMDPYRRKKALELYVISC